MRMTPSLLLAGAALLLPLLTAAQSPTGDCPGAYLLCDHTKTIQIAQVPDAGRNDREIAATRCADWPFPESNVAWFKWEIAKGGALAFTLLPLRADDDLDFVLYRLDGPLDDCDQRTEQRCMYAGANPGARESDRPCTGATGLAGYAGDQGENIGCKPGADNFLAPIETKAGERYALFVNNFRSAGGFLLEFSGDCAFKNLGPGCNALVSDPAFLRTGDGAPWHFSPAYPNPAANRVSVDIDALDSAEGEWQLIDAKGALLQTQPVSLRPGKNRVDAKLDALAPGVYFLRIRLGETAAYLGRFYKGNAK